MAEDRRNSLSPVQVADGLASTSNQLNVNEVSMALVEMCVDLRVCLHVGV